MKITPLALCLLLGAPAVCVSQKSKSVSPLLEREPADSADYKHFRHTLYLHKSGQLYERKLAMAADTTAGFTVWYDSLMEVNAGDTTQFVPLSQVIDIDSYKALDSSRFSKDKNQVYYFHPNSTGGTRLIVEGADPATFKRLFDYDWGIDKTQVYYKTFSLEGVDLKTVQALYPPGTAAPSVEYIKDATRVFYKTGPVRGADAATFRLVKGKKWDAEDKHYKFKRGGRIWNDEH